MQHECVFVRHGGLVAIQAVDHHRLDRVVVDDGSNLVGELAWGELGRVHLLNE